MWASLEALRAFVYTGQRHAGVTRRRREWSSGMGEAHLALWWIPTGRLPTVEEAEARLDRLRRYGPSPAAFTFRDPFPAGQAEAGMAPSVNAQPEK